jgi:hypothetical protein
VSSLRSAVEAEFERAAEIEQKYLELLEAVTSKFEVETRHETALRYIQERENGLPMIESTEENWENGTLGEDERYVSVVDDSSLQQLHDNIKSNYNMPIALDEDKYVD